MRIDHAILVTADLEAAGEAVLEDYGFASVSGGEHEGAGTGNRIVPFGPLYPQYIELLAAVGPASPFAELFASRIRGPVAPFGWAIAAEDLDETAGRLGLEPSDMSRRKPDGSVVSWRMVGLAEAVVSNGFLPFFISPDHDPLGKRDSGGAELEHRVVPERFAELELSGSRSELDAWLGAHDLPIKVTAGTPGLRMMAVATSSGIVEIR